MASKPRVKLSGSDVLLGLKNNIRDEHISLYYETVGVRVDILIYVSSSILQQLA